MHSQITKISSLQNFHAIQYFIDTNDILQHIIGIEILKEFGIDAKVKLLNLVSNEVELHNMHESNP